MEFNNESIGYFFFFSRIIDTFFLLIFFIDELNIYDVQPESYRSKHSYLQLNVQYVTVKYLISILQLK